MINLNLIEDIIDIIKEDTRHNVKICIDSSDITIYLDDDLENTFEEKYIIPVRYDSLYGYCYIPHDEYIKCMDDDCDGGIDKEEVDLIQKIMKYLEDNKETLNQYCYALSQSLRNEEDDNKECD